MNATIQAIRNVDEASAGQDQKIAQARASRRALPTAKNAEYSNMASLVVAHRQAEIERLFDEQTVEIADIDRAYGSKIDAEAANRDSLMKQLEESQMRLKRLEAEKTRVKTEKREHYSREIAEARKTIEAFEAAAGILAKPVE